MILNDIKAKLKELDSNVFYGAVDPKIRESVWDYIVFDRQGISPNASKTGYSYNFAVHIVREEYVPEGFEIEVINKMLEISGMRISGDMTFDYMMKPNTNIVVEMLTIGFVRPVKAG